MLMSPNEVFPPALVNTFTDKTSVPITNLFKNNNNNYVYQQIASCMLQLLNALQVYTYLKSKCLINVN